MPAAASAAGASRNAPRLALVNGRWILTEHGNSRSLTAEEVPGAQQYVTQFWTQFPTGFQPGQGPQSNEGYDPPPAGDVTRPKTMAEWQQWFMKLVEGKPFTPDQLKALAPELAKYGVSVETNAAGVAGKIKLPDGTIVDVIQGAGIGGKAWQWDAGPGGSGGLGDKYGSLMADFPETFSYAPKPATAPFVFGEAEIAPFTGKWSYGDFVAPTEEEFYQDPSYKIRFAEGLRAADASASAAATRGSGGTLKALTRYGGEQASKEYGNVFGRKLSTYGVNRDTSKMGFDSDLATYGINATNQANRFGRAFQAWQANTGAADSDWLTNYNKALNEFQMRYGIWNTGQTNRFNRLFQLGTLGRGAAGTMTGAS